MLRVADRPFACTHLLRPAVAGHSLRTDLAGVDTQVSRESQEPEIRNTHLARARFAGASQRVTPAP